MCTIYSIYRREKERRTKEEFLLPGLSHQKSKTPHETKWVFLVLSLFFLPDLTPPHLDQKSKVYHIDSIPDPKNLTAETNLEAKAKSNLLQYTSTQRVEQKRAETDTHRSNDDNDDFNYGG